ncbi:mitotic-spindle organizing protein 2A [Trichonephila clavipes]|nr:mitotic-spindle organizing protein 2A [Trichonephila clavipes]
MNEFAVKDVRVNKNTVVDWYMFCREVCMVAVLNESEPLGGEGKIVEIDESMFGKMKYGKGKPVNGQWVFGGVERNSNKCFFTVVPNRKKEELLSVIKEWVVPRSVIISDCWKAYNCLSHESYRHLRDNHSLTFKDPETGAHTNSTEGTWSAIKRSLRNHAAHVEGDFDHYLTKYMWRRRRGHSLDDDVFENFSVRSPHCTLPRRKTFLLLSPSLAIIRTQPTASFGGTAEIRQRFRETRDKYYFIFSFNV